MILKTIELTPLQRRILMKGFGNEASLVIVNKFNQIDQNFKTIKEEIEQNSELK